MLFAGQEWAECVQPQVGIGGDSVHAQHFEGGAGVGGGGVTHVVELGVEDDGQVAGDARDEVLVWDNLELWIYTQDDNPRMGNTYAPDREPIYNHSMHHMNRSLPGW